MQLSISNLASTPESIARYTNLIEIAPTKIAEWSGLTYQRCIEYKKYLDNFRLKVTALQSILYGISDQFYLPKHYLATHLTHVADIASWLGATHIILGSPKNRKKVMGGSKLQVAKALYNWLEYLEQYKIMVALEANPPQYGGEYWTTLEECHQFVQLIGHPLFKLHVDTGCMILGGESPDFLKLNPSAFTDLSYIHISDPHLAPSSFFLSNIHQHIHISEALQNIQFRGIYSLEALNLTDIELADAVQFIRKVYGGESSQN